TTRRRCSSVRRDHWVISSMVRPQPTQTFRASSTQTLTQGDATGGDGGVMTEKADKPDYGDASPILQTLFTDKCRSPVSLQGRRQQPGPGRGCVLAAGQSSVSLAPAI